MKSTFMTAFYVAVMMILLFSLMFLVSCAKKTIKDDGSNQQTPNPGTGTTTCTANKTTAENIQMFPTDNAWNRDISADVVDPYSSQILTAYSSASIKPDFGSGLWQGAPIGIPYTVVCGNQAKLNVNFTDYGDESDAGPYAIPLNAPVEGNGTGDSHVISVDVDNGILYELFNAHVSDDHWNASSGAIFNLRSNQLRPETWTSADAAGLPVYAGLVRYDEVLKGEIDHAIRFTLTSANVKPAYIYPARHKVSSGGGQYSLPFGARIRLKADFNISSYSAQNQVILRAMKKYGLMLADIGSNMYISGAPDDRWNNDDLRKLSQVKASDFEVVKFNN